MDSETARTLGAIEAHMDNSVKAQERIDATLTKMDLRIDKADNKADKAHIRIDKYELTARTMKYVCGLIAAAVALLLK